MEEQALEWEEDEALQQIQAQLQGVKEEAAAAEYVSQMPRQYYHMSASGMDTPAESSDED